MNQILKNLNEDQINDVTELVQTYGVEPNDVIYFQNELYPFLKYKAMTAMCNQLLKPTLIDVYPVPSVQPDSLSLKCVIEFQDKQIRNGVGVVNYFEKFGGEELSDTEIYDLASARAMRNALKNAGVDLFKLHKQQRGTVYDFRVKSGIASLLGQAHKLGKDALLIQGNNKQAWYKLLKTRYDVNSSNELSETQLADFVAVLKTLAPQQPLPIAA
jgi:hypothetical protein